MKLSFCQTHQTSALTFLIVALDHCCHSDTLLTHHWWLLCHCSIDSTDHQWVDWQRVEKWVFVTLLASANIVTSIDPRNTQRSLIWIVISVVGDLSQAPVLSETQESISTVESIMWQGWREVVVSLFMSGVDILGFRHHLTWSDLSQLCVWGLDTVSAVSDVSDGERKQTNQQQRWGETCH